MRYSEQQQLLADLRLHENKMKPDDRREYDMLRKRTKDEEELDALAQQRLLELHKRYAAKRTRADAEELWKKITGGAESPGE